MPLSSFRITFKIAPSPTRIEVFDCSPLPRRMAHSRVSRSADCPGGFACQTATAAGTAEAGNGSSAESVTSGAPPAFAGYQRCRWINALSALSASVPVPQAKDGTKEPRDRQPIRKMGNTRRTCGRL